MHVLFSLLTGLIFGLGLILAGMANPAKVLAFLDLAGAWDPSLALVMGGAIAISVIPFAMAKKRERSLLGLTIQLPTSRVIDKRLVLGGLAFGIGWGLVGICPAPAFVLLGVGGLKAIIFVVAMLAGMAIYEWLEMIRLKQK
ncbi:MAG TPA: YeeE/YedE family protein [Methylotenera sp.]|nr:YeeE/YedE family protein [Methylotenera sp.]HPH05626.1 YeeE/YedE family protein [Methylotenera sp.]HPN01947.1 YeeE/YedE family protein [Methylotenera sp.]